MRGEWGGGAIVRGLVTRRRGRGNGEWLSSAVSWFSVEREEWGEAIVRGLVDRYRDRGLVDYKRVFRGCREWGSNYLRAGDRCRRGMVMSRPRGRMRRTGTKAGKTRFFGKFRLISSFIR